MSEPTIFDYSGDPISTDQGTIYDYQSGLGEYLFATMQSTVDKGPTTGLLNIGGFFHADMMALAGEAPWVDAETARKEVAGTGLDISIPEYGLTRYELDTIKWLKRREAAHGLAMARRSGTGSSILGFGAALAGGLTDPINVASAFIPFVPAARYSAMVAQASGAAGRLAIRAGVGVAEGAAGAALVEPFAYLGAQSAQLEYSPVDSFVNVVLGGVLGGGLHSLGGVAFDFLNAKQLAAAKAIGDFLPYLSERQAAANAPESVKLEALQSAVRALEDDAPVRADEHFEAWHGSPHKFDEFKIEAMGTGEGNQAFGDGFYFAQNKTVGTVYRDELSKTYSVGRGGTNAGDLAQKYIDEVGGDLAKALENFQAFLSQKYAGKAPRFGEIGYETYKRNLETLDILKGGEPKGNLYEVRISGKPSDFPEYVGEPGQEARDFAAKARADGKRGIRYLDYESRDSGDGTYNYVVFDPSDVTVVARNGEPINAPKRTVGTEVDEDAAITSAQADGSVRNAEDLENVAADVEFLDAQINGLKSRDMWTKADEAAMEAGEETAKKLEDTASIYRAAAVCMVE